MRLLDAILPSRSGVSGRASEAYYDGLTGYATFAVGGQAYTVPLQTTMPGQKAETIANSFEGYVLNGLMGNGVIYGLAATRLRVFSEARFQYQRFNGGRPGDLFGDRSLELLESPWPGGVTGDLLAIMALHGDFAGNAYVASIGGQLVPMRPDWVDIILGERHYTDSGGYTGTVGKEKLGFNYYEGGKRMGAQPVTFLADEVAHFCPMPDPLASYRGMSWLTPVIREIRADQAASGHKLAFFENAAPQPLDAAVLTPAGWRKMGDIEVDDLVTGADGKAHRVLGVYPKGVQPVYRVTFSGGASTECTIDHLWEVATAYDRRRDVAQTLPLGEIIKRGVRYESGAAKWSIPLPEPVEYDEVSALPIAPYLLGVLLGDGSFRGNGKGSGGVSLAAHIDDADEMADRLGPILPVGVSITRRDRGGWSEFYFKGRGGPCANPLTLAIRGLGLDGCHGRDKAVPDIYMRASVGDRVALLQGLIDTDGHVGLRQGNLVRFNNTSETLVRQVAELVGSLGGIATCAPSGNKSGTPQWQVTVKRLPEWIVPVRLARKVARFQPLRRGGRYRYIQSIERVADKPTQCIKLDSVHGLYVTDDFVVTHNTPNLAVSLKELTDPDQFEAFVDKMDNAHSGWQNAYKTLYLGAGADVTVIGADMKSMDFSNVVGKGETRLAAAAGVPPVVAGLSEGLQGSSLNAGNFGQARRQFADQTCWPWWRNVSGSLEVLLRDKPGGCRLWVDSRDVAFLREDQADLATIQQAHSTAIRELFMAGFTPDSIVAAVTSDDLTLLKHTGALSIQVQTPGVGNTKLPATVDTPPVGTESTQDVPPQKPAALPAPAA